MKPTYSPKEFGRLIGRTTNTLQRWDRQEILKAHRTPTDRRYYTHDQYLKVMGKKAASRYIVTYCRVSSAGQKKDLISQRNAVDFFCLASGRAIDKKLEDIGSGLNYTRRNFVFLMEYGLRKYKKKILEMFREE